MMEAEAQREEEIFDAARFMRDAGDRRRFLDRACGSNRVMRSRIESLLAAESEAEAFFAATSAVLKSEPAAKALAKLNDPSTAPAELLGEEPIGSRIGRYKLLQKLGEGGCGVVYMAEQEEPVRRRVALKIIKLGMETKSVIARFEAERQALAMMDHPHIARVFDAGATERGRPYFVMELVRGTKITDFCDQDHLGMRERLDLFVQVCHAIQHAHQKGIIHGDIKPSNILVTLHDGVPVPKVIDFGISKATEARLTDKVLFTAYAQLIGTPAYMSPEQAEMSGLDIDTRSDIYSLGVLLYELLTGRTPFDAKELLQAGFDEMRKTLREKEPPRPSLRLNTLQRQELAKTAAFRRSEPPALVSLLKGDLDWIVMKCLEKDRGRRYETANGLAMDVQRHLHNEPVMARPPSRLYRFRKLVRRNRVVFAAGGAVAAALVAGMSVSTWLFLREREARQRAVAAEQQQARLRHEAEIRERVTQASLLVSMERFEEADAQLLDIVMSQPTVEGSAVFRSLGEWHAVQSRWKQAAERFAVLLRVDQLDGLDVATLDYLRYGPSLIESGDFEGYERFREQAILRFTSTPCPFADRIIKISLLRAASKKTLEAMAPLIEENAKGVSQAQAAGDSFQASWRALSFALWEYRNGNYLAAVDWAQRCLDCPEYNAPRAAAARLVWAMALHGSGKTGDARVEFAAAREIVENKFRSSLDRGTPVHGFWFDRVFARILQREAALLILGATDV